MVLLFLIAAGTLIYAFTRTEELTKQVRLLTQQVEDLQTQLRRLHVKIVSQLPGFFDEKAAAPQPPPARASFTPAPDAVVPPISQPPPAAPRPVVLPAAAPRPAFIRPEFSPQIDWEKFMGIKLFAWLGGFALFLGVAFFVKYSIDHNLISPLMRVMIGFVMGIGVIAGGLLLRPKGYDVTVQTLCAAGISILYADIFACRSLYNFLTPETAFPLMILVTVTSFFLAVRLDSRYVAILGLCGGFLTPVLLSTGVDRPVALFSYIALLDAGVIAVAIKKRSPTVRRPLAGSLGERWGFLIGLAAAATFVMELGWTGRFFSPAKGEIAFGIYALMSFLFLIAAEVADRMDQQEPLHYLPGAVMPLAAMGFVGYMLTFSSLAGRPGLVLTLLLLLSLQTAYMAVRFDAARPVYTLSGGVTFVLLLVWTTGYLKSELLLSGLGYYMAFALVHAALPILLQRMKPSNTPLLGASAAPVLMLALILFAMIFCDLLSFIIWPFVFLIGMLAIAVAWMAGSILAAGATLALIMASFGVWLFRLPDAGGLPGILTLLALFACAFFAWGLMVTRKVSLFAGNAPFSKAGGIRPEDAAQLPAFSALMPFALIAMACMKLKIPDPSQIFILIALMGVLLLGLVRYRALDLVALVAMICTGLVEYVWHTQNFSPQQPVAAIAWYLGFYALYLLFPFVALKRTESKGNGGSWAWIASALSGPVHFWLVYNAVTQAAGKGSIGLIPALFAAPSLIALYRVIGSVDKTDPRRNSLLAWFGGVALFFITLVIPIQFDKEWITLGWALEGAALLWLLQRVPHEGLKTWAVALLSIAFVRLCLNPAVLSYHPRTSVPLWNWYLFVYGVSAVCFFISARWVKAPRNLFMESDLPPILNTLGAVLLFLLLNIEIADYFSTGATITFNFSGNFAQDLTYSLAWAVFAIGLLVVGIRQSAQGARYASIGLLLVTILKVFLHDLWQLGQLFRVASFVGLAVILILVSFLYQKYIGQEKGGEVRRG